MEEEGILRDRNCIDARYPIPIVRENAILRSSLFREIRYSG